MINPFRFLFNTFFACCGGCIGMRYNPIVMCCLSFVGAFIGDLLWAIIVEGLC